ncbi:MAG: SAM-dependent methyltransferase [Isosphaera sp.]|nr:SAM-dependent methyltransferase [Isosphaera sp.]
MGRTMTGSDLSHMDPVGRFTTRARDYAAARPDYPRAAIDAILEDLDTTRCVVVDAGAGTGIMTRQLAAQLRDRATVHALEPNPAMRAVLVAARLPRVQPRDAPAEGTGLPDRSADAVVCACAFHWFRTGDALREFARVLRPGGRLAIVSNERDPAHGATRRLMGISARASGGHPAETWAMADPGALGLGLFTGHRLTVHAHAQRLDLRGLVARLRSASYIPAQGPAWDAAAAQLHALHAAFADARGLVTLRYLTPVLTMTRQA